jgi:hypothetical protein
MFCLIIADRWRTCHTVEACFYSNNVRSDYYKIQILHFRFTTGRTSTEHLRFATVKQQIKFKFSVGMLLGFPLFRTLIVGPCHGSGGYSPGSHRGGPGSRPAQSMRNLWWTTWCLDRFFSEFFGFPWQYISTVALNTHISPGDEQ